MREEMRVDEIVGRWTEKRDEIFTRADDDKQAQSAVISLSSEYARLSPSERAVIDGLLGQWILSEDERERFAARVLAKDHRIANLLPALHQLAARLRQRRSHSAPFEFKRVSEVIESLEGET
jgi:hypothetical protein